MNTVLALESIHSLVKANETYVCFQGYRCKNWDIFIDVIAVDIIG